MIPASLSPINSMANGTHTTLRNDCSPTSPNVEITKAQRGIAISLTTANTFKGQVSDADGEHYQMSL